MLPPRSPGLGPLILKWALPDGFKLGSPPVYYDINTTATFTGSVEVCFTWEEGTFSNESTIVIQHIVNGAWEPLPTTVDETNNVACGTTDSFSIFIVAEVEHGFSGILQPINADGSSIFKAGRVVPVKFQLFGPDGAPITDSVATLELFKISSAVLGTEEEVEVTSPGAATTGNAFRYDADKQQYIFNLSMKVLSTGTYRADIHTDDGSVNSVQFSLK